MLRNLVSNFLIFVLIAYWSGKVNADALYHYKEIQKSCDKRCSLRGNCNIELGVCECPLGLTGPSCNVELFPSCKISKNSEPFTGFFLPKSCACLEQLVSYYKCDKYACTNKLYLVLAKSYARCYKYKNGSEFEFSSLPDKNDPNVQWFARKGLDQPVYQEINSAEGMMGSTYQTKRFQIQPFDKCPGSCSFRGSCILSNSNTTTRCICLPGFLGESCESEDESMCINQCRGRGLCHRGFCHCQAPWFGVDCSRSKAFGLVDGEGEDMGKEGAEEGKYGEQGTWKGYIEEEDRDKGDGGEEEDREGAKEEEPTGRKERREKEKGKKEEIMETKKKTKIKKKRDEGDDEELESGFPSKKTTKAKEPKIPQKLDPKSSSKSDPKSSSSKLNLSFRSERDGVWRDFEKPNLMQIIPDPKLMAKVTDKVRQEVSKVVGHYQEEEKKRMEEQRQAMKPYTEEPQNTPLAPPYNLFENELFTKGQRRDISSKTSDESTVRSEREGKATTLLKVPRTIAATMKKKAEFPMPVRNWVKIYVYEIPNYVSHHVSAETLLLDYPDMYRASYVFLSQLLMDPVVRTENPYEATLFYIPVHLYVAASNTQNFALSHHLKHAVQYVRQQYPFFNSSRGKDHVVWLPGDLGGCFLPRGMSEVEYSNMIKISHFGLRLNPNLASTRGPARSKFRTASDGCTNPLRDVVAAPYFSPTVSAIKALHHQILKTNGLDPNRRQLLFFAGNIRPKQLPHSGGVRQAVANLVRRQYANDPRIVITNKFLTPSIYFGHYINSTFCLAPYGSGFSDRLVIAAAYGCIPVIIQDHVIQPYNDVLPYYEFSVRLRRQEIPNLISHLQSYNKTDVARMRLRLAEVYNSLLWIPTLNGQAYNLTIRSLGNRVENHYWGNIG